MQKVYLRADADLQIGFGHFTRTLALADMLKDDFECTFFTQSPTEYQRREVEKVCRLVELPSDDSKFSIFLDLLNGDEIVFLDNYFFTSEYEKAIKDKGCKLVCISPNGRHHFADVLLNFSESPLSEFDVEPYTNICRGIGWTILRPPFLKSVGAAARKKGSVAISFGGTDQFGLTEAVVDLLASENTNSEIHILSTDIIGEKRIDSLRNRGCLMHVGSSANEVASLFRSVEKAILSTSTVATEALSQGCEVYAGYYVDNQYKFYNYLSDNGYIIGLGDLLENDMIAKLRTLLTSANQFSNSKLPDGLFATKYQYVNLFKSL